MAHKLKKPLPDLNLLLFFFREGQGWSQTELAEKAGTSPKLISDYEAGRKPLTRGRLEFLIGCMGIPPERLDASLATLHGNRAASRSAAGPPGAFAERWRRVEALALHGGNLATEFIRALLGPLVLEGEALPVRQHAEVLWQRLQKRTPAERRRLVEGVRKYQTWGLCERVAAESLALAANHPREARELARLALAIAERVPGEETWRWRNEGYALAHVANAERACSDLPAAGEAFARAARRWQAGAPGDPGLLNPAVLPWIEAGLRKAQRRFPEALERVDEALALDRGELRGKILITKSNVLEALADPEGSTAVLLEAIPLIDVRQEPRLALVVNFNLIADLCQLDHPAEAALRLPEVRRLAEALGENLDLTKVVWLEGKVRAGLGRAAEAQADFEQVRHTYEDERLPYHCALVSLDLALLHLQAGRTAEVRALASEMLWIFRAEGVSQEALAALKLFCAAAERETATVELVRRLSRYLERAQEDPSLSFEREEGAEIV